MNPRLRLTLLALLASTLLAAQQPSDSLVYTPVDPDDFLTLLRFKENAVLIDVRLPFEFRKERLEGALNIPVVKTGKRHQDKLDERSVILLYCTTDFRSSRVAVKYYNLGFRQIYDLRGGIEAWKRKGLPVMKRHK